MLLGEQKESLLPDFTSRNLSDKYSDKTILSLAVHFLIYLMEDNRLSYFLRVGPPANSASQDLHLSRDTSEFSRVSPSGTLPGSEINAGEGAGLRANGRAQGSLEQVV